MMTITITFLQPPARDLTVDLPLFVSLAERLFGVVNVQVVDTTMAEFDAILAEVRSKPITPRLTKAQMAAIEAERPGQYEYETRWTR